MDVVVVSMVVVLPVNVVVNMVTVVPVKLTVAFLKVVNPSMVSVNPIPVIRSLMNPLPRIRFLLMDVVVVSMVVVHPVNAVVNMAIVVPVIITVLLLKVVNPSMVSVKPIPTVTLRLTPLKKSLQMENVVVIMENAHRVNVVVNMVIVALDQSIVVPDVKVPLENVIKEQLNNYQPLFNLKF